MALSPTLRRSPHGLTTSVVAWAIALALALALLASHDSAEASAPGHINASISHDWVQAQQFPPNTTLTLTIEDGGGAGLFSGGKLSDGSGFADWERGEHDIELLPGMVLTITDGALTKALVLAALTVAVDYDSEVVSGTVDSPDGTTVRVTASSEGSCCENRETTVSAGVWSVSFAPFDLTFQHFVNASVDDADGDTTVADAPRPNIAASVNHFWVNAQQFAPGNTLTLTIEDSDGANLFTDSKLSDGDGFAQWSRDEHGVSLEPGMALSVTDGILTKTLVLAALTVTVNADSDLVSGTAAGSPDGTTVRVVAFTEGSCCENREAAVSGGTWSVSFAPFDLTLQHFVNASIEDPDGDETVAAALRPRIAASVNHFWVNAADFAAVTTLTLTIEDAGGANLFTDSKPSDGDGFAQWSRDEHGVELEPGMTLTVSDDATTKTLTLVALTVVVDYETDVVSGTAPDGTTVRVVAFTEGSCCENREAAVSGGVWSVSFAPFDLIFLHFVNASVDDVDGDQTVAAILRPHINASVSDSWVNAQEFAPNTTLTLTIEDPGGASLFTDNKLSDGDGFVQWNRDEHAVALLPGMALTVTDGALTKTLVLAALTVAVDYETDVVSGTAAGSPDGTPVRVTASSEGSCCENRETTVSAGVWSVSFAPFDLTFQHFVHASVDDPDGDTTVANALRPRINVSISHFWVQAQEFAANTDLTLTVEDGGGVNVFTGVKLSNGDGFVQWNRDEHGVSLLPGMALTVTDGALTKTLVLAALTVAVDYDSEVVSGAANSPNGTTVRVVASNQDFCCEERQTTVTAGVWSVSFAPFDLTFQHFISARIDDADGDTTVADALRPRINVSISHFWVQAQEFAGDTELTLTIDGGDGANLFTDIKLSNGDGFAQWNRDEHGVSLLPGMALTITDGTLIKTLVLAALTVAVDYDSEVVSGAANSPDGTTVRVVASNQDFCCEERQTTVSAGVWSVSFAPFDLTFQHFLSARIDDADGDTTIADARRPRIAASIKHFWINANEFAANTDLTLTIEDGGGVNVFTGVKLSNSDGFADWDRGEHGIELLPGMAISVTDGTLTKTLMLADLTVIVDYDSDIVSGVAPPGQTVFVDVESLPSCCVEVPADPSTGAWSTDFTGLIDITAGLGVWAWVNDDDGDQTQASASRTSINASVSDFWVNAQEFAPNTTLTLTIEDASGANLFTVSKLSDADGFAHWNRDEHGVELLPGMALSVTDGTVTKTLELAALTAAVDYETDIVSGTAPDGATVDVVVSSPDFCCENREAPVSAGTWTASFAPFNLTFLHFISARLPDADGDTTVATPVLTLAGPITVTRFDDPIPDSCSVDDCSLREALFAARSSPGPDTIVLPAGIYVLSLAGADQNFDGDGDLDITDEVTITGAGQGTTIIDGGGIYRVIEIHETGSLDISGVTIRNGNASVSAGVRTLGTLEMRDSTLTLNVATSFGGGLGIVPGAVATLTNVTITDNEAGVVGGGIVTAGSLMIVDSVVSGNSAGLFGGGIWNGGPATVTLIDSVVSNNSATSGGGIYNTNRIIDGELNVGTVVIDGTVLSGNVAGQSGGGIYNNSGTLVISGSALIGNTATAGQGGALLNVDGVTGDGTPLGTANATIEFSAIAGNSDGGGAGSGVVNGLTSVLTATNNWWGCADGPGAGGCDTVVGSGNFDPWLAALEVTADPTQAVGSSIAVSATLFDSDGIEAGGNELIARFTRDGVNPLPLPGDEQPFLSPATHSYTGTSAGDDLVSATVLFAGEPSALTGATTVTWFIDAVGDSDGDGIANAIDGTFDGAFTDQSGVPSDAFTDQHLGGTTFGQIVDRDGLTVSVDDANADATDGVLLTATDGAGTATVNACGIDVQLTTGDSVIVTCGSLTVEVITGPVEVQATDDTVITVPSDTTVTITSGDGDGATVVSSEESSGTVIVESGGSTVELAPGETRAVGSLVALKQAAIGQLSPYAGESKRFERAIEAIEMSLDPGLWLSDASLDALHGKQVFDHERHAVNELTKAIEDTANGGPDALSLEALEAAITVRDLLVVVDRTLAKAAIEEAENAGEVTPRNLSKASDELAMGDDATADGQFDKAIEHYRKAWQRVTGAPGNDGDDSDD